MNNKKFKQRILSLLFFTTTIFGAQIDSVRAQAPKGWLAGGANPQNYEMGTDTTISHSGKASAYIKPKSAKPAQWATLLQRFSAEEYSGKRLKMSGFVKTEKVENRVWVWMRVDGPNGEMLGFDNMRNRPIKGSTDWKNHSIILDVPKNSALISFGIGLVGKGQAWLDDVHLEIVSNDVETTGVLQEFPVQPTNLDFSSYTEGEIPEGWFASGDNPQNYEMAVDQTVTHGGKASGYIKSKVSEPTGFGSMMQMFKADNYKGKRLRFSGNAKSKNIDNWAGLWMRIDGPGNQALGFDNMKNRPVKGTTEWNKHEIVLDVPENSVHIALGLLLYGKGHFWVNDLHLEAVGKEVSTTNMIAEMGEKIEKEIEEAKKRRKEMMKEAHPKQPRNLDFEG